MRKLMNKKGFTIIELIVVLAILGVILGIAIPRYASLQSESELKADKATAALIINSARLMEANEALTSGDVVSEATGAESGSLDVSANGVEGTAVYLQPTGDSQSNESAFTLSFADDKYTVTFGDETFNEGDKIQ